MDRIIGIGEYTISNQEEDTIKTYALASCIAVTVYHPKKKAAGMIHIALPCPSLNDQAATNRPYHYAMTGVPLFIKKFCTAYGCLEKELDIKLFGGADSIRKEDMFRIGRKNIAAVKAVLQDKGLRCSTQELGGTNSRTLEMKVATGVISMILQPITI